MKRIYLLFSLIIINTTIAYIYSCNINSKIKNELEIDINEKIDIGCIELFINNKYDKSYISCDYKNYKIKNLPKEISTIRLDLGDKKDATFTINKIVFKDDGDVINEINLNDLPKWSKDQITISKDGLVKITDIDPKVYGNVDIKFNDGSIEKKYQVLIYAISIIFNIFLILKIIKIFKKNKLNQKNKDKIIFNITLVSAFFVIISSYPGHTNYDEFYMLTQYFNKNMDGLQPPLHTIVWGGLIEFFDNFGINKFISVGSILIIQVSVYIVSLKKLLETINSKFLKYFSLLTLTILPVFLVSLGHTGKDTQMFIAFFAAFTLLKLASEEMNISSLILSLILIFYGSFVRSNGIAGGIVLLYYWINCCYSYYKGKKINIYNGIIYTFILSLTLIACNIYIMKIAIKNHCCDSVQIIMTPIYDLMGMSVRINNNIVPKIIYTDRYELDDIKKYYNTYDLDWTGLKIASYEMLPEIGMHWLSEIINHPKEYIQHRLDILTNFFGFYSGKPKYPYFLGFYTNTSSAGTNSQINQILNDYSEGKKYLEFQDKLNKYYSIGSPFFYRYVLYLIIVIGSYFIAIKNKINIPMSTNILLLSGLFYSVPYIIIGTSSHFRYVLWSCFAFYLATILNIDKIIQSKYEKNN